jgi:glycosyltransferase involved in cell wall biosynthesis
MKLVFITRKVDRNDSLTGFVFSWIEKLAQNLEKLYVICQEKGDVSGLPKNVEVFSFGKEKGYGKLRQGYQLFVISFKLARSANGFFVHMHPIYAVIAWLPAKLLGRKLILWYTHKAVDWKLRLATMLVDEVFTASPESFRIKSGKVKVVGHGTDLTKFQIPCLAGRQANSPPKAYPPLADKFQTNPKSQNHKFKILSIGRISPVKDYETLIKAVEILYHHKNVKDIEVEIYGKIGLPEHQSYLDSLVEFVRNANLEEVIKFQGELNYEYVDEVYQEADLFVNLSQTGSIDKAVLEAAASGTLVLTSNEAFGPPFSKISPLLFFSRNDPEDLAGKILEISSLSEMEKKSLRLKLCQWVKENHNLDDLVKIIVNEFLKQ